MQYHTYATTENKTHGFVIRGLENNPEPEEIKNELVQQNIQVKEVYKMKNTMKPMYLVITTANETIKSVEKKAPVVCYVVVRWEKHINKKGMTQCHRCQAWGHATGNCKVDPKCLKCGEKHETRQCNLNEDQDPKCANCGEKHTANSTDCKVYKERMKYIEERKQKFEKMKENKKKYVPAPPPAENAWT
ncbi:hypothetical protein BDFB_014404, partial [Asbolus verrucosus]